MGAANVAACYAMWGAELRTKHAAFRLLTFMANTALDTDDKPRFWGGRDALVYALGHTLPDVDDDSEAAKKQRRSLYESVRQNLAELAAAGAIEQLVHARQGQRAEYALHLTRQADLGPQTQGDLAERQGLLADGQDALGPKEETGGLGTLSGEDRPTVSTSPASSDECKKDLEPSLCDAPFGTTRDDWQWAWRRALDLVPAGRTRTGLRAVARDELRHVLQASA